MRRWELTLFANFDLEEGVVGQWRRAVGTALADAGGRGVVNSVCDPVRRHDAVVPSLREQSIG